MTRIGSIGSLGAAQLRALNRIGELGQAISANTTRLSTLKRINSAKDDPAGLVQATRLEQEIAVAKEVSQGVTRASAMLSTADTTASEIVTQLQSARTLVLEVAGGTLSSSDSAANQIQVDEILRSVDNLARTEFNGRRLLDGTSGYRATGVDTSTILGVDVLSKSSADDVTVTIDLTTQATQATDSYTDGKLASDTTFLVEGPNGTATFFLKKDQKTNDIADAFNAVTYLTGITATKIDGSQVDFQTLDYGSAAVIKIEATQGTFDTASGGSAAGTDAVATINGQQVTGDGSTFNVNTSQVSLVIELDPTAATGSVNPFIVSGEGLEFVIGTSAGSTARVGIPNLTTSSLGGITGKLTSIISGGANTLTGGKAAEALQILDDAIADATRGQAVIGGFQKFTLASSSRVLSSTMENVSSALSAVQDTDVALETALLANNQLLRQTTFQALSITNLQNQDVLSLLKTTAARF